MSINKYNLLTNPIQEVTDEEDQSHLFWPNMKFSQNKNNNNASNALKLFYLCFRGKENITAS